MSIGNEKYFFDLMDVLVQWSKHENHEPFDLLSIRVCKNYKQSTDLVTTFLVIGDIGDSDREVEEFFSFAKHAPSDQDFIDNMNEWFELGKPFGEAESYAYYQSCCSLPKGEDVFAAMDYLKQKCNAKYPGVNINFVKPVDRYSGGKSKGGCYIATAVYGSYNCPEVWTLRRFRDYKLRKSFLGRLFIKIYYATSPKIVKCFGETQWFNRFWKGRLDKLVKRLELEGFKNTPYDDED